MKKAMEQFIEQRVCEEIDILTMKLLSVIDENLEKVESYGESGQRILPNAVFNLILNMYRPSSNSFLVDQKYSRYAEQSRQDYNKLVKYLNEFSSTKVYR